MYALIEVSGTQLKVEKGQQVFVNRLEGEEGANVEFDKVMFIRKDADTVEVGAPVIEGAKVTARIVEHLKGDKVLVFKKKRRKGYQKLNGHRQYLTKVEIQDITA